MKTKPTFTFISAERNCTNYDISVPFNGVHNRKVNKASVADISEKIKTVGFVGYITLLQTRAFGKLEIRTADGQHRLDAARLVNAPFNYELLKLVEDTKDNVNNFISGMNSVGTRWSNNNHLEKQVELNKHEYIVFDNCLKNSKLKITDLLNIFLGGATAKEVKEFKSGKMKFENEKAALKMFEDVKKASEFLPNKAFSRRALYKNINNVKSPAKLFKLIIGSKRFLKIENETDLGTELQKAYQQAA